MKYDTMTAAQLSDYIKQMDSRITQLKKDRVKILQEMKDMRQRKEILPWEEIASAVAYPKTMSDQERVRENPDEYKLLHQAERIHKLYVSQMEDLFEELEGVEIQIAKHKYVTRCISRLDKDSKDIIERFVRNNMSYESGAEMFHSSRSSFYRQLKRALRELSDIYNNCLPNS